MDAPTTVSVGTTATLIATGGSVILDPEGDIRVGGAGVTTTNGIRVASGVLFPYELHPDEALYAVAASTTTVRLLRSTGA